MTQQLVSKFERSSHRDTPMFTRTSSTFWSAYRGPEGLIRVKTICFPKACSFNPTLSKHTIPSHINHYIPLLHIWSNTCLWVNQVIGPQQRESKLQSSAAKARIPWLSGTLRKVRDHAFRAGDVGDSELPDGLPLAVLTSLGGLRMNEKANHGLNKKTRKELLKQGEKWWCR